MTWAFIVVVVGGLNFGYQAFGGGGYTFEECRKAMSEYNLAQELGSKKGDGGPVSGYMKCVPHTDNYDWFDNEMDRLDAAIDKVYGNDR